MSQLAERKPEAGRWMGLARLSLMAQSMLPPGMPSLVPMEEMFCSLLQQNNNEMI